MISLGKLHGVVDAGHDLLPLEDRDEIRKVCARPCHCGVDISCQSWHATSNHGDAPDDHVWTRRGLEPGDESAECLIQLGGDLPRSGALAAHRANRSFSFLQAARACATSRRRTASGGSWRRLAQCDRRSWAASNASSAVSTVVAALDARAARSFLAGDHRAQCFGRPEETRRWRGLHHPRLPRQLARRAVRELVADGAELTSTTKARPPNDSRSAAGRGAEIRGSADRPQQRGVRRRQVNWVLRAPRRARWRRQPSRSSARAAPARSRPGYARVPRRAR